MLSFDIENLMGNMILEVCTVLQLCPYSYEVERINSIRFGVSLEWMLNEQMNKNYKC